MLSFSNNSYIITATFASVMLQFRAERVLLLSELSIKEKEKYYTLFIKDEVKFRPLSDGRYVGNMRILAPNVKKSAFSSPASMENLLNSIMSRILILKIIIIFR